MQNIISPRACTAAVIFSLLAGCSSDPATFTTYAHQKGNVGDQIAVRAPRYTDALALDYANSVESVFRAKATGARYTREASTTALAGISTFSAAAGTLGYGASTVATLGIVGAGVVQLQHIFDAKGRTNAYFEAAERIHSAIKDFVALNLNNVSDEHLTPNGWTLANIVQANIDMVDKVLNGHLPTTEDMIQAMEPMSPRGATPQSTGTSPVNNISTSRNALPAHLGPKTTTVTPPRADSSSGVSTAVRTGRSILSEQVVQMRRNGEHDRARAILAAHQTPTVPDEDPIETVARAVSAIHTPEALKSWQQAFAASLLNLPAGGTGTPLEGSKLPAHLKPNETTTTPDSAPKRN